VQTAPRRSRQLQRLLAETSIEGMRHDRDVGNGIVANLVSGKGEEFVGLIDDAKGLLVLGFAPAVVPFDSGLFGPAAASHLAS
jgi:hypothetical protein